MPTECLGFNSGIFSSTGSQVAGARNTSEKLLPVRPDNTGLDGLMAWLLGIKYLESKPSLITFWFHSGSNFWKDKNGIVPTSGILSTSKHAVGLFVPHTVFWALLIDSRWSGNAPAERDAACMAAGKEGNLPSSFLDQTCLLDPTQYSLNCMLAEGQILQYLKKAQHGGLLIWTFIWIEWPYY